ncbi:glycosyltransferase, partial [Acinetobacter baumannii]
ALLRACLQSIYRHPPSEPFEVIVVDNASRDGSATMVQQEFPQVTLIANTENLGYARGNNQAMQRAQGAFVLLLNPDT